MQLNPNARLSVIREKVEAGQRLSFDDGLFLPKTADLFTLGELANIGARTQERQCRLLQRQHAPQSDQRLRLSLHLLRLSGRPEEPQGLRDDATSRSCERAAEADGRGATELHIVGGLHHQLPYEWYLNVVRIIHEAHPRLHLKAYTAVEWDWFARLTGRPTRDLLAEFKEAGLGSLPGGGAEIFHPEVRDKICEHKADADAWLRIHREAHELGLRSNATMLYGHIEKPGIASTTCAGCASCRTRPAASRPSFRSPSIPTTPRLSPHSQGERPAWTCRMMAISRLMLDNFPHIKAYWVMLGIKTAQIALSFGADDIDGTVVHEKIYHDAG